MHTSIIDLEDKTDIEGLAKAAIALREGQVVAFPTETVYGLGAVWNNSEAIHDIFRIKGRPLDNPLIIHESDIMRMKSYYKEWDIVAETLTRCFCPGPFTLIMRKADHIETIATAGMDTIGVRIPSHPVAQALINEVGTGIAAPSANLSGRPSPTNAHDCYEDLAGKVPYILAAGDSRFGLESTIVSWKDGVLEILRPGSISKQAIASCLEEAQIKLTIKQSYRGDEVSEARAPGMKYKHYAPKAKVFILEGDSINEKVKGLEHYEKLELINIRSAFYISENLLSALKDANKLLNYEHVLTFADEENYTVQEEAGKGLFAAFRHFDRLGANAIFVEALSLDGVGAAYMNRLSKASNAKS